MRRVIPAVVALLAAVHTIARSWMSVVDLIPLVETVSPGSPGAFTTLLAFGSDAVAVGSLLVVGVIGYRIGRGSDLAATYRSVLRRLAVAGAVGGAIGGGLLYGPLSVELFPAATGISAELVAIVAVVSALRGAVVVGIVGFAGGALGQFRDDARRDADRSVPTAD